MTAQPKRSFEVLKPAKQHEAEKAAVPEDLSLILEDLKVLMLAVRGMALEADEGTPIGAQNGYADSIRGRFYDVIARLDETTDKLCPFDMEATVIKFWAHCKARGI